LAVGLSACTSDGGAESAGSIVYTLISEGRFGEDEKPAASAKIPRKMAADLPYSSIGVTIDANPQFLFLLARQTATEDIYTLGYQVSVVLRRGRVIRTQGLVADMLGGRWEGEDIIRTALRSPGPVSGKRWMETNHRGIGTREAWCTARVVGEETVTILETPIATRHVQEDCRVPELKWEFTNHFWLAPSGSQIWLSVQHVHPRANPLVIETFRAATPFGAS
jgi:hypothetical protein